MSVSAVINSFGLNAMYCRVNTSIIMCLLLPYKQYVTCWCCCQCERIFYWKPNGSYPPDV